MNLMHNMVFRLIDAPHEGIYRVILDEPASGKTVLVRLDPPDISDSSRGGRPREESTKRPRPKPPLPNIGQLHWFDREELLQCEQQSSLVVVHIEPEADLLARSSSEVQNDKFQKRIRVMEEFLNFETLRDSILIDAGLGGLVRRATKAHGICRATVYKLFSLLCRHGFSQLSLHPRYDRCGAPGILRPCDPEGRAKAGAKTSKQRVAREFGEHLESEQPGMSSEWRRRILAADITIKPPKPSMPDRITRIIQKAFVTEYQQGESGKLIALEPEKGSYPNRQQIQRVLETEYSKLEFRQQRTTKGQFLRDARGLRGKSWQGVAGPGHTWAVDSTIGDVYLRSSINRNWIIGRPVVYVIVDVWSTAVVGFYVCLAGPSWDMAKVALFSSAMDPGLVGQLWNYEPVPSLFPAATLCTHLLCDRGEYLSRAASVTGMKLTLAQSYTPPYRPDLKGVVEVLHRIEKDGQFNFVPGAIDQRRKEYELRRYNPIRGALTVAEFTHYLHLMFADYNLSADRNHRLDAHMRAGGVEPTPAGLWHWGHEMGIGVQRSLPNSELISTLLPNAEATIRRDGVVYGGKIFESDVVQEREWTALARNFGSYQVPCHYYPGSVSRIWTPNFGDRGLLELQISEQSTASEELTWDEVADAEMYYRLGRSDREHAKNLTKTKTLHKLEKLIQEAEARTEEADASAMVPRPSLTDARNLEKAADHFPQVIEQEVPKQVAPNGVGGEEYAEMMRSILEKIEVKK